MLHQLQTLFYIKMLRGIMNDKLLFLSYHDRAMCLGLSGPVENPTRESFEGGFLRYFTRQMRGFLDLLWQKPSSLFVSLGRSSISIASVMMRSIHVGAVERILMLCRSTGYSNAQHCKSASQAWCSTASDTTSGVIILSTAPTCMDRSIAKSTINKKNKLTL
jgi:hypothetical protein